MKKQTAGRENLGELAPKFAELNDDVLWGQILICVDGEGWYQEEGKEARRLKPANEKHWHGATAKSWFSHIAIEVPEENTSNEWCEKVSDEEYNNLPE